jgi:hypothetical protein
MKRSSGNLEHPDSKAASYQLSREIVSQFEAQNHSSICRALKGVDTGTVLRACPDCIRDAAAIVERTLFSNND